MAILKDRIPGFNLVFENLKYQVKTNRHDFESLCGWITNRIPGSISVDELAKIEDISRKLLDAKDNDKKLDALKYEF